MFDVGHYLIAELAGFDDAVQVAFYKGDFGALHGNIGAGTHGDAYVGLRQSGYIVNAVTCYDVALFLNSLTMAYLSSGRHSA